MPQIGSIFGINAEHDSVFRLMNLGQVYRRFKKLLKVGEYLVRQITSNYVLLDTPIHGNLGDNAIVMASKQFIDQQGGKCLEITADEINRIEWLYAKLTRKNKTIIIPGGGFLGNLWPNEEERVRRILKAYKKNRIIIFPQTITFDMATDKGQAYFEESKKIYSAHKNLILYVRENKSFELVKKYMPNVNVKLAPDIVTYFIPKIKERERTNILLCFRKDKERICSDTDKSKIYEIIKSKYPSLDVKETDTVINNFISIKNRYKEVQNKLEEFSHAKLLITDRLHGMVFAAITDTPCIAFDNSSGKVKGVYNWIENNEYIKYVGDLKQFGNALDSIDINRQYTYDHDHIDKAFSILKEDIMNT